MARTILVAVGTLAVLCTSVALLQLSPGLTADNEAKLLVLGAPSLRVPLTKLAADFEQATNTRVAIRFGGSQTLLTDLRLDPDADVFAPADESYVDIARQMNLVGFGTPVAAMRATMALRKDFTPPLWEDLMAGKIRLGQADPGTAAIGKLTKDHLQANGTWQSLAHSTVVFQPTVSDVFNAVKLGALDAAIVWDVVVQGQVPTVDYAELKGISAKVSLAVTAKSKHPELAASFIRFASDARRGQVIFREAGFAPAATLHKTTP